MNLLDLTPQQLKRVAAIKEQIDRLNAELRRLLGGSSRGNRAPRKKPPMSAAARKKIAAAQKARWAKVRRAKS